MKTNFSSKLFEKKINLAEANFIFGATGGCTDMTFTGENNCDSVTDFYDDNGKKTQTITSDNCD